MTDARSPLDGAGCERRYPGPSGAGLDAFPPFERWDDWVELESRSWPRRVERRYRLVPTTCFNCESACGLLAYIDRETGEIRKLEGNPDHPGSRGRNCAKGPATLNQIEDPDRILSPLRRAGRRGEGRFERVSWDEVLDDLAGRIRRALAEGRHEEIMCHIGRPGEDGFTERVLASWGVDGHNSHTNVCSAGGRTGFQFWAGIDRPSPDYANARVIYLISSHLEAGHYFNPHAQRITEARARGAKLIVVDTRLSNTATHADYWLSPWPGSEAAINLAIASHILRTRRYDAEFIRRWWNWEEYLEACHPSEPATLERFLEILGELYAPYTFEYASRESGVPAATLEEVAEVVAGAGHRFAAHTWRAAAAGNLGGWQVARTLFLLAALLGAVATEGGTFPSAWNKFVPRPPYLPPHPERWNELTWPREFPLAQNELSFLLPHFLKDGRGRLEVYFARAYNPVWTNPDGLSWVEVLTDESLVGCVVALTPTWSETAFLADYVLPMGHAPERHDLHSYEQYDGEWVALRQPVRRVARARDDEAVPDTRATNPGEVWEENEFWIELSWRIDPDGALGIRRFYEKPDRPGEKMTVEDYYGWIAEHSIPGLPERAAAEGLAPLEWLRRHGAFEIREKVGPRHEEPVVDEELLGAVEGPHGRVYTPVPAPETPNVVPVASPPPDAEGRRPVGVRVDGVVRRGFPTPSGRLEFYSSTLAAWGWPEHAVPGYIRSHVHPSRLEPDELVLLSTFRLPTQIHTRSANAKWLDELAHTNPLWVHPDDARRIGIGRSGELVRVETEIGSFVLKAFVTDGIRPGVVACSHHMGRWRLRDGPVGQRQAMATVDLVRDGSLWRMRRVKGVGPYRSSDPDTRRIWWSDAGVHQNLTFSVHPDPISGMHCWHQIVRVRPAAVDERDGDVVVDTARAHAIYHQWLEGTRPADRFSPDGTRRPSWLIRPLRPSATAYRLPTPEGDAASERTAPSGA